jgi:GT2 family glycosyltransferase
MNDGGAPPPRIIRARRAAAGAARVPGIEQRDHPVADAISVQDQLARAKGELARFQVEAGRTADRLTLERRGLRRRVDWLQKRAGVLERAITESERAVTELERALADAETRYSTTRQELDALRASYRAIVDSTMWQALGPLRRLLGKLPAGVRRRSRRALQLVRWTLTFQLVSKQRHRRDAQAVEDAPPAQQTLPAENARPPEKTPPAEARRLRIELDNYAAWVQLYDTITDDDRQAIKAAIDRMAARPAISVVMPAYETPEPYLRAAIESVCAQLYPDWELCVADDASQSPHVRKVLEEYRSGNSRIKICYRSENGHISAASNSALALATGDYVALLDNDDILPEHALYMVAAAIAEDPSIDLLFSDEDKLDGEGRRFDPYFKPDWNPELILGQNMFSHLGVYRRSLIEEVGCFRLGYEGSQDHDLVLRASARTTPERIKHLSHILYHWRAVPGSTATDVENKTYAAEAGRRAVGDYLAQQGISATVEPSPAANFHRVRYPIAEPRPLASLIIPVGAGLETVEACLSGMLERTDYKSLELLIVVNSGTRSEVFPYLNELSNDPRVTIVGDDQPQFNFSRMCNLGAARANGELIGLINDDLEVIEPGWLDEMVSHVLRPGVGGVGAALYHPDQRIQHAGVIVGLGGVAGHPYVGQRGGAQGYFGRALLTQDLSAVTAACMVLPKAVYREVGGLDEANLPIAFNDVDLCLRVREKGYRIIFTPYARLCHHGSASRGHDSEVNNAEQFKTEVEFMQRRWGDVLQNDPYYNPNLSLLWPNFELAFPPRCTKPW